MTIASSNVDRQYIRAKIVQFGQSFIDGRGKSKSFCPLHIAQAYELDYIHVYDVLLRMVDAGQLRERGVANRKKPLFELCFRQDSPQEFLHEVPLGRFQTQKSKRGGDEVKAGKENDGMKLDAELLSLHETLGELIEMGMVTATFYPEEEGIGPSTRYSVTAAIPRRGVTSLDALRIEQTGQVQF